MSLPVDRLESLEQEVNRLREALAKCQQAQERFDKGNTRLIDDLKAGILARDEFLAIAAHELRNPMGAIVLGVQTLRIAAEKPSGLPPQLLLEKLASLERRIDQYVKRATMLLDVTRLTSGRFQFEIEVVDLTQLLREVVEDAADDLDRARCELALDLAEGVSGQWDRMAIEQVLVNLLSNAVKYGAGRPIEIKLTSDERSAHVEIRDRGIGISEDDQMRIFQKFERAVKRRQHGGFGIGLWLSRQIIHGHGGNIGVESIPDVGSTFKVTLPLQSPQGEIHERRHRRAAH